MFKEISFFIVLFISTSLYSQQTKLDTYQYIIVSDKFDFVKSTDEYQTSSLTKFLLTKKGFDVFLSSEKIPQELKKDRCTALFATIKDESSMFTTKSTIEMRDCFGQTIYTSNVGKSKEKEYKKAYNEAIRNAYASMTDFEYSYKPSSTVIIEEKKEVISTNEAVVSVTTIPEVIVLPEIIGAVKNVDSAVVITTDVLYAQKINNGFQLINTKPEVVFLILKTTLKDVFVLKGKNGVFYKVGEDWVAEYYQNNQLTRKYFQVKF